MRFFGPFLVLVAGTLCLSTPDAAADQVILGDGSVIMGTVQELTEGTIHIDTTFGGALPIPWEQVTQITVESTAAVQLASGDRVVGILQPSGQGHTVAGSALGDVPVALADVTGIWPADAAPPMDASAQAEAVEAVKADYEAKIAELESGKLELKAVWSGRAELGVNGQSGNKERIDVRLGVDINRVTDKDRLNLYLKGQYAETSSEKSANEVMGGARLEVDFTERTYVFGKIDLEFDEFEDLDLRATLTGGVGHFFVQKEKVELKGWAGIGYEHETFKSEPEPLPEPSSFEEALRQALLQSRQDNNDATSFNEAVVELGYAYRHDFTKNFRFKHGLTYYPAISAPFEEYRLAADTSFEFPLGKEPEWTLRAGVRHEYDSEPREDIDKLDTTYYLNLGYNW